ncbi:acetyltransferase (GNAT) family protein [Fontibacillus phaseoli]|uniref:Acetyltransferase (GNAT) family protein n=1 Tax=Fontibacillus phaseoli TaxID=1416533 RepID=A0A369BIL6_9BACL|nr:GNAT family N-acetyltransferase [Fontibacillus phaseoli]RCX21429.1 acetyltransferase (GNAT) family protein [Fontibacillus phaseoli]
MSNIHFPITFEPMTRDRAAVLSRWTYEGIYSIYSMEDSDECISELMNGEYFLGIDPRRNEVIGYICSGNSARVPGGYPAGIYEHHDCLDIGLGLRPDLTGKGIGQSFLIEAMGFLSVRYAITSFQLVVAAFNERAIKVYERTGFRKGECFPSKVEDREIEFLAMKCLDDIGI